jgi:DNA-binding CsgD family transcriptional regulator
MPSKLFRLQQGALTPRERQILELCAADKRDKEIAVILGVSQHTLHNHWAKIYRRLGVHSRAAAVARLLRQKVAQKGH